MVEFILVLLSFLKRYIIAIIWKRNSLFVYCRFNDLFLFKIVKYLFNYKQLLDGWAIDFPGNRVRFCVTWMCHNFLMRLFVRQFTNALSSTLSLTRLYKSANWFEREMFDLFGIFFSGNNDLRRILTDYGFIGFPLRKDFPLSGFFELRYDDLMKQIIIEPVQLSQEFRFYTCELPWVKVDRV